MRAEVERMATEDDTGCGKETATENLAPVRRALRIRQEAAADGPMNRYGWRVEFWRYKPG